MMIIRKKGRGVELGPSKQTKPQGFPHHKTTSLSGDAPWWPTWICPQVRRRPRPGFQRGSRLGSRNARSNPPKRCSNCWWLAPWKTRRLGSRHWRQRRFVLVCHRCAAAVASECKLSAGCTSWCGQQQRRDGRLRHHDHGSSGRQR